MRLGMFSDPHLGLVRSSHTTVRSREALRLRLYQQALTAISLLEAEGIEDIFCLGDLFDTYSNGEKTIAQGADVVDRLSLCLAGNHDVANREDAVGSLQLLYQRMDKTHPFDNPVILPREFGKPFYSHNYACGVEVFSVPHVANQDIFCASLEMALNATRPNHQNVLLLHCNITVPNGLEISGESTSLFLTEDWQDKLLEKFAKVFIGHEHQASSFADGRILVLGNTFPLNFGEIGDRFAYIFNPDTTEVSKLQLFDAKSESLLVTADNFIESSEDILPRAFVEITGTIYRGAQVDLAKKISAYWREHPEVLMLRNATTLEDTSSTRKPGRYSKQATKTLPEVIEEEVDAEGLRDAYSEALDTLREPEDLA